MKRVNSMDSTGACDGVCSTGIPWKSSASTARSCSATERYRQELEDYVVKFDVRPPSGTFHQQPGKHLSIDTRFSELSLENSSLIAESEREPNTLHRSAAVGSIYRNKNRPRRVQIPKENIYITSPFKQGPEKDVKGPALVVDPSFELKQRTISGVTKVKQHLNKTKRTRNFNLPPPQLHSGSLKPLGRPMTASGPLMKNCQGIVAGARRYHGFARRHTNGSLGSAKPSRVFSASDIANSSSARPDSPNQLLRPESSIHNISCASSVDEADNDSDGNFSEDGSEDSIDETNQAESTLDYNKDMGHSEENLRCSSTGNENHVEVDISCKPYFDHSVKRHSDDDSDREEGHWAKQTQHSVGFHGGGATRATETRSGGIKTNNAHGKQRRLRSSCEGQCDRDIIKTDLLNVSSLKSRQKRRDKLRLRCTDGSDVREVVEPPSSPLYVNSGRVIDVHIRVKSGRKQNATLDTDGFLLTPCDDQAVGPLRGFDSDFNKDDVDDCLDSDALDSNRIPSADIFKVLDTLNLSTSSVKPPTLRGERSRARRVQSAGYTRQTANATKDKKAFEKGAKSSRPPSSKQAGKRKGKNKDFHDSANLNTTVTAPALIEKAGDLTKHVRESLPGYFTEQYKKILDERNENGKSMNETTVVDGAQSSSLSLATREMTQADVGRDLDRGTDPHQNDQSVLTGDFKENSRYPQMVNGKSDLKNANFLNDGQDDGSEDRKASRSSLTEVFVTIDDKNDLRGFHDVEDGSSGVETMSCVTDSSSFDNLGVTRNQSNCDSAWSFGRGHSYPDVQHYDCGDKVDDDDDGGDVDCVDDANDGSSNLEVVAKPMPLSESRYLLKKKPIAPFPPLCFNINAKPPDGQLYYFAYGPEMNPNRMSIYLRREPKTRLWGILFGFQLTFNKRGTSDEAGGFPNVEFNPDHSVEGCVYAITETELCMLDNCMGYPKHYVRVVFPVWMLNCASPSEHGVAQYCVPAVFYVAQDEWITHDSSQKLDCSYSVSQCLKAADILTPNYIQFLTSQARS